MRVASRGYSQEELKRATKIQNDPSNYLQKSSHFVSQIGEPWSMTVMNKDGLIIASAEESQLKARLLEYN